MKAILFVLAFICVIAGTNAAFSYPSRCFFSVAQHDGVWWFVDPNGKPFISKGVDLVNRNGDSDSTGTAAYANTIRNKYGSNYEAWGRDTAAQVTSWGMNTFGAWSDYENFSNKSVPFTIALSFAAKWSSASGLSPFPDVFDEGYASTAADIASGIAPYVNNPYLIGYFLDNELWWGDDWRARYSILSLYLNRTGTPGYNKALAFVKSKYSNIGALNRAWGINAGSFETLKTQWPYNTTNPNHIANSADFLYQVAYQYFSVAVKALKSVDPNHLILGAKHVGVPHEPVCRAESQWGDVFSFDSYNIKVPASQMRDAYDKTQRKMPALIAEFSFRSSENVGGLPNLRGGGGVPVVPTQVERAAQFQVYVEDAIKAPHLIGLHWFQWPDQPAAGRWLGLEDSNLGLVDMNNNRYVALTNRMASVYPTLDAIHGSVPASLPAVCKATVPCPNNCNGKGCCNYNTGVCTCDNDYIGITCETYIGAYTDTFQTFDSVASRWIRSSGFGDGGFWMTDQALSFSSSGLNIAARNTGCPTASVCNGRRGFTSGVTSKRYYDYGRVDFSIKMPQSEIPLTVSWLSSIHGQGDGLQISINSVSRNLVISRWKVGESTNWGGATLPFDPTTAYHTYSFVKPKVTRGVPYFLIYADSILLANYTSVVPVAEGKFKVIPYADPVPANPNVNYLIQSIKYTPSFVATPCAQTFTVPSTGFLLSKDNGKYVNQDNWNFLVGTAATTATATLFNFATVTGGHSIYALKNAQFVKSDHNTGDKLIANSASVGGWETFVFSQPQSGVYAFTSNSKYVGVSGSNYVDGSNVPLTISSLFKIVVPDAPRAAVNIATATQIKLFSKAAGAYITVNSNNLLYAGVGDVIAATTFNVRYTSNLYTLQSTTSSKYATSPNYGNNPVSIDKDYPSVPGWEAFVFISKGNNAFAIQATVNSKLLSLQANGQFIASQASTGTTPDAALFFIAAVPPTASIDVYAATKIKLYSKAAGAYVVVDSSNYLVGSAYTAASAATFNVGHPSASHITLQNAATSQWATAGNYGKDAVTASRPYPSVPGWEAFFFVPQGDAYAILASSNNMLLTLQSNGQFKATLANDGTIIDSALFYVVAA